MSTSRSVRRPSLPCEAVSARTIAASSGATRCIERPRRDGHAVVTRAYRPAFDPNDARATTRQVQQACTMPHPTKDAPRRRRAHVRPATAPGRDQRSFALPNANPRRLRDYLRSASCQPRRYRRKPKPHERIPIRIDDNPSRVERNPVRVEGKVLGLKKALKWTRNSGTRTN